jgi:PAS domain S-box-containing protein
VGETSQQLRFNQQLLEAALENMSQGISVVDAELRLVAWNRRYETLFGYPPGLAQGRARDRRARAPQRRARAARRRRARAAWWRGGSTTCARARRTSRSGVSPTAPVVEIRGNPMPGGGFVATFTDVTAFRRAEQG